LDGVVGVLLIVEQGHHLLAVRMSLALVPARF